MPTKLIEVALPLDVINEEVGRRRPSDTGIPQHCIYGGHVDRSLHVGQSYSRSSLTTRPHTRSRSRPKRIRTASASACSTSSSDWFRGKLQPTRRSLKRHGRRFGAAIRRAAPDPRPVLRWRLDPARSTAARARSPRERPQPRRCAHHQGADRASAEVRGSTAGPPGPGRPCKGRSLGGVRRASPRTFATTASGCATRPSAGSGTSTRRPVLPDGNQPLSSHGSGRRTVTCPNPACRSTMPLVRSLWLGKKKGKEAWVNPVPDQIARRVRFEIGHGTQGPPVEGTVIEPARPASCAMCRSH